MYVGTLSYLLHDSVFILIFLYRISGPLCSTWIFGRGILYEFYWGETLPFHIRFYYFPSYLTLSYFFLTCSVILLPILLYHIPSLPVLSYSFLTYSIIFLPILFSHFSLRCSIIFLPILLCHILPYPARLYISLSCSIMFLPFLLFYSLSYFLRCYQKSTISSHVCHHVVTIFLTSIPYLTFPCFSLLPT